MKYLKIALLSQLMNTALWLMFYLVYNYVTWEWFNIIERLLNLPNWSHLARSGFGFYYLLFYVLVVGFVVKRKRGEGTTLEI